MTVLLQCEYIPEEVIRTMLACDFGRTSWAAGVATTDLDFARMSCVDVVFSLA